MAGPRHDGAQGVKVRAITWKLVRQLAFSTMVRSPADMYDLGAVGDSYFGVPTSSPIWSGQNERVER